MLKLGCLKKWEDVKLCVIVGEANKIQRIFFQKMWILFAVACGWFILMDEARQFVPGVFLNYRFDIFLYC